MRIRASAARATPSQNGIARGPTVSFGWPGGMVRRVATHHATAKARRRNPATRSRRLALIAASLPLQSELGHQLRELGVIRRNRLAELSGRREGGFEPKVFPGLLEFRRL